MSELEPHQWMKFSVISRKKDRDLTPPAEDTVSIFKASLTE